MRQASHLAASVAALKALQSLPEDLQRFCHRSHREQQIFSGDVFNQRRCVLKKMVINFECDCGWMCLLGSFNLCNLAC